MEKRKKGKTTTKNKRIVTTGSKDAEEKYPKNAFLFDRFFPFLRSGALGLIFWGSPKVFFRF